MMKGAIQELLKRKKNLIYKRLTGENLKIIPHYQFKIIVLIK